jgi:Icc-related predicted phosphoesterase
MPNLLVMSDLHCDFERFSPEAIGAEPGSFDGLIIAGDITNRGDNCLTSEWYKAYGFFEAWRDFLGPRPPIYFIGGNHDFGITEFAGHVSHLATFIQDKGVITTPWHKNFLDFDDNPVPITIAGFNLSPCYTLPLLEKRWTNMTANEAFEIDYWASAPYADIVVSHCPAFGIMDFANGLNLGSKPLLAYLKKNCPDLFVCGHIHEDIGFKPQLSSPLKGTHYVNTATTTMMVYL